MLFIFTTKKVIGPNDLNEKFIQSYCGKKHKPPQPAIVKGEKQLIYFRFNVEARETRYQAFYQTKIESTNWFSTKKPIRVPMRLQLWNIPLEQIEEFINDQGILQAIESHGCICTCNYSQFRQNLPVRYSN